MSAPVSAPERRAPGPLTFGSVCSGIEAASVAWHPLGWRTAFVSEIDKHASAVLRHRFPDTPNLGDFTTIQKTDATRIDLLVGGTPCQAFSVAGLRKGFADDRGNLTLEFLRLADRLGPEWVVWENVPGVLSIDGGRAFGSFLGGLAELGYGFAYRVLDAQWAGVPQRRRRVFVVGHLGDWRRAGAVLFERAGLSGHPPPSREAGAGVAGFTEAGFGEWREGCRTLRAEGGSAHGGSETLIPQTVHGKTVTPAMLASGASAVGGTQDGMNDVHPVAFNWQSGGDCRQNPSASVPDALTCHQTPAVTYALAVRGRDGGAQIQMGEPNGPYNTLRAGDGGSSRQSLVAIGFQAKDDGGNLGHGVAPTLLNQHTSAGDARALQVRRLTPVECERLQGFPDGWTETGDYGDGVDDDGNPVPKPVPMSDTQRYKQCGNSMAVPVMRWIGQRIDLVRSLTQSVSEHAEAGSLR